MSETLDYAKNIMLEEAKAVEALANELTTSFSNAVDLISEVRLRSYYSFWYGEGRFRWNENFRHTCECWDSIFLFKSS